MALFRNFSVMLLLACFSMPCRSQEFSKYFLDKTLRIDYIFSGNNSQQYISLSELCTSDGWYGRRHHLNELVLNGNGQITMTDTTGCDTLYRHSFSTLFQEWQNTEEATKAVRSFENVFLLPMPKEPVLVTVSLFDTHHRTVGTLAHKVVPTDILIRPLPSKKNKWSYLKQAGDSRECIDFVFVAEGYTESEMPRFYEACNRSIQSILSHKPFGELAQYLNFIAVPCVSEDNGVSIPGRNLWKQTAVQSNFDTFYSSRYLTTLHIRKLHDLLSGIPYEHIIILANTDNYGGGGIYNSYMMTAADNPTNPQVVVHELGHSFAGLADEYYYDDQYEVMYPSDVEPWEPNITTLFQFEKKWKDMLPVNCQIPTKPNGKDVYTNVGVYEGAGYQSKGVYRPVQNCRMKTNQAPAFCPVCQKAIKRMILFNASE